jgi:hypothetical protein
VDVFVDTEFAGGIEKIDAQRYLISIGLVAEDSRERYYELDDTYDDHLCSLWVHQNVIPLLDGGDFRIGVTELAARLKSWIESLTNDEVILRTDAPAYDWPFIEELFNFYGWPKNLRRTCGTMDFESVHQVLRYETAVAEYFITHDSRQHHALVDARAMQYAWRFALKVTDP